MTERVLTLEDAERLIQPVIHFPDIQASFSRVRPLTDFRRDETEGRVLYICQLVQLHGEDRELVSPRTFTDEFYILKCKVQTPSKLAGGLVEPIPGPNEHTVDELKALKAFADTSSPGLPHLVAWKRFSQGTDGPLPGGYISCMVMTIVPGENLLDLGFWSMTFEQQQEIRDAFLAVLKHVWKLGFRPYDCALRNILWKAETRELSLVDFEHWRAITDDMMSMIDDREEMQRWGLLHRRPPAEAWKEWMRAYNTTWK